MFTKRPLKKIIGAKTKAALEKQIKVEAHGRWYPISDIKFLSMIQDHTRCYYDSEKG